MKNRKFLIIGLITLVLLCLVTIGVYSFIRQINQGKELPMIQIHQPANHEQLPYGKGVIIHTTGYAQSGVSSLELWVDDHFISAKTPPSVQISTELPLSAAWVPYPLGNHRIIIRATSKDGGTNQVSILVEAVDFVGQQPTSYVIREGDTIESVAEAFDISEESILEVNEELDQGGALEVGDELTLPPGEREIPDLFDGRSADSESGSTSDELEPELESEDEPPEPSLEIDPSIFELLSTVFTAQIPTQLQIEVLSLQTEDPYNFLHCYASLADAIPQWMPDDDFNQTTDESFFSMAGVGRNWDVASHLAGENAMDLAWVMSEPVPMELSCMGIRDGGLEAVELGRVTDEIEPSQWGVIQSAYSIGGESSFHLSYKVSFPAKGLDTSITPPSNVNTNEENHIMSWDYPDEELENIDGFAILLNDTLQWTVHQSIQEVDIPPEWFILPCGDEYRFTVIAYRIDYPEGDYSLPSEPAIITGGEVGGEGCNRTILVSFETLTTGDLGRNPSPVYGSLYANDQLLAFDGRPIEDDNFPTTFGLRSNEVYDISRIMYGFGDNQTELVVELPPGRWDVEEGSLWLGFDIYQSREKVCAGEVSIPENRYAGTYHGMIQTESPVGFFPDWCIVNYTIHPVGETPVVEPGAPPPLPNLVVEEISPDLGSGRPRIHIRNTGLATWSEQDIVLKVTSIEGEQIGIYEWPDLTLAPGEKLILSHGGLNPVPPLGICVLIDPENEVEEEIDRKISEGILLERHTYCRPLPDLTIEQVTYDSAFSQLHIDIKNQGQRPITSADDGGSLINANLAVWLVFDEGRPLIQEYSELDLDLRQTKTLLWPLNEVERDRMREGYTVIINPGQSIAEIDYSNNEYQVESTSKLRILWKAGWANFCETGNTLIYGENIGGKNTWQMHFTASVQGAEITQRVVDWESPEFEINWRDGGGGDPWCRVYLSDWFEVAGDESLVITPWADLDITSYGYRWFSGGSDILTAVDDFGGTTHVPPDLNENCFDQSVHYPYISYHTTFSLGSCGPLNCDSLGDTGEHIVGPLPARSEDITNTCYWSTSYFIFREVED
jgi:hypothetical protein